MTAAAYIILGIALIGRELENPFGDDITDIDMDAFLRQLKVEINILTSTPPPKAEDFIATEENFPLGPKSTLSYSAAKQMSMEGTIMFGQANGVEIREYLKNKVTMGKVVMNQKITESKLGNSTGVDLV